MFSQEELMETQWDIVIANLKGPKTITFLKENIEDFSSGSSPYRADVLKLGLKKAFELKKKKTRAPVPPEVWLRCSNSGCEWHRTQAQVWRLADVGSDLFCRSRSSQGWGNIDYWQCTGCGFNRAGHYASCQGCGAKFA